MQAVNVFEAMSTQWRVGAAGATGLDYVALPIVMCAQGIPEAQQPQILDAIRVMEDAALREIRKR